MFVIQAIKIALRGLRVNKMRSSLTMLGIIIGVAAVITMLAVGEGARTSLANSVASLGTNLILVLPGSTTSGGARMGTGNTSTLVVDDWDRWWIGTPETMPARGKISRISMDFASHSGLKYMSLSA